MNMYLIIIPVAVIVIIAIVTFLIISKKKKKDSEEIEQFENIPLDINQEFPDEPLEPLGNSIIDKEFEGLPDANANLSSVELTQDTIKPVFDLNIDTPITAQEKGTMEVEKKEEEVTSKIDVFKECPVCHTKVEPTATTCFLCGAKLN